MNNIVVKKELAPKIKLFDIYAPEIAAKAKPGNFVILRIDERGKGFRSQSQVLIYPRES